MVQKVNFTMRDYAFEKVMGRKPKSKNKSEWVEELMLRGLDSMDSQNSVSYENEEELVMDSPGVEPGVSP